MTVSPYLTRPKRELWRTTSFLMAGIFAAGRWPHVAHECAMLVIALEANNA